MPKKPPAKALPTKQSVLRIVVLMLSLAALALCARMLEQAPKADVLEEGDDAVVEEGSGSQVEAKEAALRAWEEKKEKSENFRKLFTEVQGTRDSIQAQIANMEKRRVQNRSTCAADLRQANKHTQLPIALRCYRGELNLHTDILRKEKNLLETMPISSEQLQTESLQVMDALIDAMSSIVNAIDTKVYASLQDLEETKQNLREVYLEPKWLQDNKVKADVLLSWSASLAVRTALLMEQYSQTNPELQAQLFEGLQCLEEGDEILVSVHEKETYKKAAKAITKYEKHFADCVELFPTEDV